jgi:hypothetical protein
VRLAWVTRIAAWWLATMVVVTAAAGCRRHEAASGPPATRAFYYWRTTFALGPAELRAVTALAVSRIYLRMFDVAWSEADHAATPVGRVSRADGATVPDGVELVPVIYLEAEVFRHVGRAQVPALARRLWAEVEARAAVIGFRPRALQLDCDWTETTRDGFFALVRELKLASGVPLSATIRLHQIKYRERTGVPPVDRGMLMFYNMGRFSADPEARAIFDPAAAARYLARLDDYPLALDVALPIWSWTVHVRDDVVVGLLQSTDPAELAHVDLVRPAGPDRYVAIRTGFLHGTLVREGDILKTEVTGPTETRAAAAMLAAHLPPTPAAGPARTISLFDLSERNLTRHGNDQLDQVLRAVR